MTLVFFWESEDLPLALKLTLGKIILLAFCQLVLSAPFGLLIAKRNILSYSVCDESKRGSYSKVN